MSNGIKMRVIDRAFHSRKPGGKPEILKPGDIIIYGGPQTKLEPLRCGFTGDYLRNGDGEVRTKQVSALPKWAVPVTGKTDDVEAVKARALK